MKIFSKKQGIVLLLVLSIFVMAYSGGARLIHQWSPILGDIFPEWRSAERIYTAVRDRVDSRPVAGEQRTVEEDFILQTVIDGDTVKGWYRGREETVRFIGINAPETGGPYRQAECFGKEAKEHLAEILTSTQSVKVESDPSQGERDRYGRLLLYIITPEGDVAERMIANGFAYEYTYHTAYKKQAVFRLAEQSARGKKIGVWQAGNCPEALSK